MVKLFAFPYNMYNQLLNSYKKKKKKQLEFDNTELNQYVSLNRIVILIILTLPIHGMSSRLLQSSLISLSSILWFSVCYIDA